MTIIRDLLLIMVCLVLLVYGSIVLISLLKDECIIPKTSPLFEYVLDSKELCSEYAINETTLQCQTRSYIWEIDCFDDVCTQRMIL